MYIVSLALRADKRLWGRDWGNEISKFDTLVIHTKVCWNYLLRVNDSIYINTSLAWEERGLKSEQLSVDAQDREQWKEWIADLTSNDP